jgi:DNA-binding NarL/FixJ family response regulator
MPLSDLVKAVKKVIAGGRYMHAATGEKLAGYLAIANASLHGGLSEHELQVMKFIAEGRSLKEIAHELSLSAKTISTYRTRILEKLHLRSNAELTRYVLERRVIA